MCGLRLRIWSHSVTVRASCDVDMLQQCFPLGKSRLPSERGDWRRVEGLSYHAKVTALLDLWLGSCKPQIEGTLLYVGLPLSVKINQNSGGHSGNKTLWYLPLSYLCSFVVSASSSSSHVLTISKQRHIYILPNLWPLLPTHCPATVAMFVRPSGIDWLVRGSSGRLSCCCF